MCCAIWTFWSVMAKRHLVRVYLSVTTLDPRLARVDGAVRGYPRLCGDLHAIEELTRADMCAHSGILTAPMIPGLNDAENGEVAGGRRTSGCSACLVHFAAVAA